MDTLENVNTDTTARSMTSHALQLLMCHCGLQSFYDQSNGLDLLKVSIHNIIQVKVQGCTYL